MSTNAGKFGNMFYTQINRETIGRPESASLNRYFWCGVDPKAIQAGAKNWKRYRDDTLDIEENWNSHKVKEFTQYVNESKFE